MNVEKLRRLKELGSKRKAAAWDGYFQISDFHDGKYDSEFVSPYTKGADNTDSKVFLLLQDWSSFDFLSNPVLDLDAIRIGRTPHLPTNRNLAKLLKEFFQSGLNDVFATNLFPFIKPGKMNQRIETTNYLRAAHEFAIPQIEIVDPQIVVCFGLQVAKAMRRAVAELATKKLGDIIGSPVIVRSRQYWFQAHPGGQGMAARGGFQKLRSDWASMIASMQSSIKPA